MDTKYQTIVRYARITSQMTMDCQVCVGGLTANVHLYLVDEDDGGSCSRYIVVAHRVCMARFLKEQFRLPIYDEGIV